MNIDRYNQIIRAKIVKNTKVVGNCWIWQKSISNTGYGLINYHRTMKNVHRLSYILFRDEQIPEGYDLDHLCRNRKCCNPLHLEIVTRIENCKRSPIHNAGKKFCKNGHEFTIENTYHVNKKNRNPSRQCRICTLESNRKSFLKLRCN